MKVNWNFVSFMLAVLAVFQLYFTTSDFKKSNSELIKLMNIFELKIYDVVENHLSKIKTMYENDTSLNILNFLQEDKNIKLLKNKNNIKFENKNILSSSFRTLQNLPKSIALSNENINQLNLISSQIELTSRLKQFLKLNSIAKDTNTIFLFKNSICEYYPLAKLNVQSLFQFTINSDSLAPSSNNFMLYENKLLKKYNNVLKCKILNPLTKIDDSFSRNFDL